MSVIVPHLVMVFTLAARGLVRMDMKEHKFDVWIVNTRLPSVRRFILLWIYSTFVCEESLQTLRVVQHKIAWASLHLSFCDSTVQGVVKMLPLLHSGTTVSSPTPPMSGTAWTVVSHQDVS